MANTDSTLSFTEEELATEEWRNVVGYEGRYIVSSLGRLASLVRGVGPVALRPRVGTRGYRQCGLIGDDGKHTTHSLHTLVCEAFHGKRPDGMQTNHIDLNRLNNRANNLEWVTPLQNVRHSIAKRIELGLRKPKPTAPPRPPREWATITDDMARDVFRSRASGESVSSIASRLGISDMRVYLVLNGKLMPHIRAEMLSDSSISCALSREKWSRRNSWHSLRYKLTPSDVVAIRRRHANGETQASLRREYGIGENQMSDLVHRRSWRWVTDEAA